VIGSQADRLRLIASGQASFQPPRRSARTIAVASGKGGVGKTNLAVNLGLALARRGVATTIIDLDLGLANIDIVLGIHAPLTLREVVDGRCSLEHALVAAPYGLRVLCGGSGILELANLGRQQQEQLIAALARLDELADVVLLDIGAGIAPTSLRFIGAAGEVMVVTTTEPTAMADAYALIKLVHRQAPATIFNLVVNQVGRRDEAQEVALTLMSVARRFLGATIHPLGYLPWDERLTSAVKQRAPVLVAHPRAPFSVAVERLGERIHAAAPPVSPATTAFGGFLRRLTGGMFGS
jgi:flagellar biosynthesis protein FlhG